MTIQQKIPYSSAPGGVAWCDPSRDIAHSFPGLVRRALEVAEYDINNNSELDSACKQSAIDSLKVDAKILAGFIKSSYGESRTESLQSALRTNGILLPQSISSIFLRAFAKVVLSAYWTGLGFALHGQGERPVDSDIVDQYAKK